MNNEEKVAALEAKIKEISDQIANLKNNYACIRKEHSELKARVLDMQQELHENFEDTTHHFEKIYSYMGDIYDDYIWPVVRKVFPGWEADNKIITGLKKGGREKP